MPKMKLPKGTVRVRCLGPTMPEHWFASRDKTTHRVCPACEAKIAAAGKIMREPTLPSSK